MRCSRQAVSVSETWARAKEKKKDIKPASYLTLDEYATALILFCFIYKEKNKRKGFLIYFCDSFRLTLCGICKGEKVRGQRFMIVLKK